MNKWKKLEITRIKESSGSLSVIEQNSIFDFDVKRLFFVSHVSSGETRGKHAHKELKQIIFSSSGSFKIMLDDGSKKEEFELTQGGYGLYVEGLVWRTMHAFSCDAVMTVLCDRIYADDVVIRNYNDFIEEVNNVQ